MKSLFRWTVIRNLGELQVLTKASYFLLIFVPILAGLWPGVKGVVNQYNVIVENSVNILENASKSLDIEVKKFELTANSNNLGKINDIADEINRSVGKLKSHIDKLIEETTYLTIENNYLPMTWVVMFLSSLCIFIAHMIYQSGCPSLIQNYDLNDFLTKEKDEYTKYPTDRIIKMYKRIIDDMNYNVGDEPIGKLDESLDQFESRKRKWELEIIETGARVVYYRESTKNSSTGIVTGIFYTIGIMLILYVVFEQTLSVLRAGGVI